MSGFIAEILLFNAGTAEFMQLIPPQRMLVNELMAEGILTSYAVAADRSKLWCILEVETETEAFDVLGRFPIAPFMAIELHPLMFYNMNATLMGSISLN
jgi:muconolactone delta-isomerase